MRPFQIVVSISQQTYRLQVTPKESMDESERYEVKARNHLFIFETNRPALAAIKADHGPWVWNVIEGKGPKYFVDEIRNELQKAIKHILWAEKNKLG